MRDRPEDLGLLPLRTAPDGGRRAGDARWRRSRRCASRSASRAFWMLARHVLRLRRQHQRPDRHAPDRRVPRLRHSGGPLGAAAGDDGDLRHPRHDGLGLADRSLLEPPSAVRLLHAARHLAALPAVHAAERRRTALAWFAVFYGLDWIATVPPTVRLTSEAFGRENTGVIYGWIGASHQLGASMAAFGAGAIRTMLGDYQRRRSGSPACCACSPACRSSPSAGARSSRVMDRTAAPCRRRQRRADSATPGRRATPDSDF